MKRAPRTCSSRPVGTPVHPRGCPIPWSRAVGAGVANAGSRAYAGVAMSTTVSARRLLGRRIECAALDQLVAAAQACGEVRADVAGVDIAMLMMAATNTCAPANELQPQLWRRYLALMLDGLRPGATSALPAPALTGARVSRGRRALTRGGAVGGRRTVS